MGRKGTLSDQQLFISAATIPALRSNSKIGDNRVAHSRISGQMPILRCLGRGG